MTVGFLAAINLEFTGPTPPKPAHERLTPL